MNEWDEQQQPEPQPQPQGASPTKMEESAWDLTELAEEDFEQLAVYIVPDAVVEPPAAPQPGAPQASTASAASPAAQGRNRSELSLPRNLVLKSSQALSDVLGVWSSGYIPRGTRFGPLVGEIYAKDHVPKHANRKYFWRVSPASFIHLSDLKFLTRLSSHSLPRLPDLY